MPVDSHVRFEKVKAKAKPAAIMAPVDVVKIAAKHFHGEKL